MKMQNTTMQKPHLLRKVAKKRKMSSVRSCRARWSFLQWNHQKQGGHNVTFSEKLKLYRQQAGMSQEKLAEKIGVSRQAITKWETNAGIPDIENMMALSSLFDVTIDELLSAEKSTKKQPDYLYESVTEYDIDCPKRYDMKLGGAKYLKLSGYDGEKIRIRLASNTLQTLSRDFKLKIDDVKNRIDIDLSRKNGATEAMAKEAVSIFVQIPAPYI